jgi:hypothetical protein
VLHLERDRDIFDGSPRRAIFALDRTSDRLSMVVASDVAP